VKRAIISDVHGNLEALSAVLEDIDREGVDAIVCLGDIVGYGPDPCGCVRLVQERCGLVILGNHDQGALFDPEGFNVRADRAIRWTRQQLEQHDRLPRNAANQISDYLGELPRTHVEGDFQFVHGSPRRPLDEYVFPEDAYNHLKMTHLFQLVGRYCFQGHTHIPGIFTTNPAFIPPAVAVGETEVVLPLPEDKAMINVGSVGQPRDGDPRASYAIVEDQRQVRFRRIAYPWEETARKIHAIAHLDNYLGDRLAVGQ